MAAPLSTELVLLGWSVVLLLVHVALQAALVLPEKGFMWNAGPRDGVQLPQGAYAGRAGRALHNFGETYPAFVAVALALAVTGRTGGAGQTGAWLWFAARIAFLPLYLFGVPWLRSAAFGVSVIGLAMMLARLL